MNSTNTINIIKFIAATVFAFGIILATVLIVNLPAHTEHTQISFSDNIFMKIENAADLMNPNDNIKLFQKIREAKQWRKTNPSQKTQITIPTVRCQIKKILRTIRI